MKEKKFVVSINTIDKVKKFVNITSSFIQDFDLVSGRYVIDGKSIMGIFSLDLSKDIELIVHYEDDEDMAKIKDALASFVVKEM
jgi:phosphotransferase system HPr-like phosphotransfer protein